MLFNLRFQGGTPLVAEGIPMQCPAQQSRLTSDFISVKGKRSAQPGTGEGVRIEARRGKTWQLHRQGLIHESRPRRGTLDQRFFFPTLGFVGCFSSHTSPNILVLPSL